MAAFPPPHDNYGHKGTFLISSLEKGFEETGDRLLLLACSPGVCMVCGLLEPPSMYDVLCVFVGVKIYLNAMVHC